MDASILSRVEILEKAIYNSHGIYKCLQRGIA